MIRPARNKVERAGRVCRWHNGEVIKLLRFIPIHAATPPGDMKEAGVPPLASDILGVG